MWWYSPVCIGPGRKFRRQGFSRCGSLQPLSIISCREELQDHLSNGNLSHLCVCFSRDDQPDGSPRYVQDNIRAHGAALVKLIEEHHAVVYVCGDARNMAKDVNQAFVDIFSSVKG